MLPRAVAGGLLRAAEGLVPPAARNTGQLLAATACGHQHCKPGLQPARAPLLLPQPPRAASHQSTPGHLRRDGRATPGQLCAMMSGTQQRFLGYSLVRWRVQSLYAGGRAKCTTIEHMFHGSSFQSTNEIQILTARRSHQCVCKSLNDRGHFRDAVAKRSFGNNVIVSNKRAEGE